MERNHVENISAFRKLMLQYESASTWSVCALIDPVSPAMKSIRTTSALFVEHFVNLQKIFWRFLDVTGKSFWNQPASTLCIGSTAVLNLPKTLILAFPSKQWGEVTVILSYWVDSIWIKVQGWGHGIEFLFFKFADWFDTFVENNYINTDLCKSESSQSHQSRAQSANSSKTLWLSPSEKISNIYSS